MAITLKAQTLAEEARAKYEASLTALRTFIADFPQIEKRVEEHDQRLNALETRFAELRHEIASVISEAEVATGKVQAKPASIVTQDSSIIVDVREENVSPDSMPRTKVSFCADEVDEWRYSFQEHEGHIPVHGHWLPPSVTAHRRSFAEASDIAKNLGGRRVILEPQGIDDVEKVECIMVEPMGKILSPAEFVSTGLIICLDGTSHESDLLAEWGEVLKATKWLDSGMSFALPDVSNLAEAADLEVIVEAVLHKGGFQTCVLVGKGWGATMICEIAGRSKLSECIDGVLLVAPESPVPSEFSSIEAPVMLVWAEDDEVSDFREIYEWVEILRKRSTPNFVKDLAKGGHDLAQLFKSEEAAAQVLHFMVSCLLIGHLLKALDEAAKRLSEPCTRLCDELPIFLASQIGGDAEEGVAAALSGDDASRVKRRMKSLLSRLKKWIQDGLQEMASATE